MADLAHALDLTVSELESIGASNGCSAPSAAATRELLELVEDGEVVSRGDAGQDVGEEFHRALGSGRRSGLQWADSCASSAEQA